MTRRLISAVITLLLATSASAGSQATASKAALATDSPAATQVGLNVLRSGGNAIDAAVAVSFALAVLRPDSGNLGGGGFLTYFEAQTGSVWSLDFRETAPDDVKVAAAFDGSALPGQGARAAGVPGTVAGLEAMHRRFGSRPWKELLQPAILLAREGIRVDAELAMLLERASADRHIEAFPSTASLFFHDGKPLPAGARLVQNDLAATLARIAGTGGRDLYTGGLAERLVAASQQAGGTISRRDLRGYAPVWRAPIRIRYADCDIFTAAPPSGGGLVIAETLGILAPYDLAGSGFETTRTVHLMVEAERRAWIDRNNYAGDPAEARVPYRELLSPQRAAAWRASIKPDQVTPTVSLAAPGMTTERDHTTHFTIADSRGNVAAVTTSLDGDFGSGFLLPDLGFFLNDAMADFTPSPGKPNREGLVQGSANSPAGGRRPASSMSPTIVLRGGKPYLAIGSAGGPTIPTTLLQVLLNVVVWHKPLFDAVDAPRYHHQSQPDQIVYETSRARRQVVDELNRLGHSVVGRESIGDVQAVLFDGGKITAIADPRHGGAAGGY